MSAKERLQKRKPLEQRCWIAPESNQSLIECFFRDISHSGAKLILHAEIKLPSKFDLYLTPDGTVGRQCEVMWQNSNEVGVKFIGRAVPLRSLDEPVKPAVVEVS